MPELPEVETIRIGLIRLLQGQFISDVSFDWLKSFPNSPSDVKQFLVGSKVLNVKRRAKVLLIELSSNYSLVIHLKMTGQLVYVRYADKLTANSLQPTAEEKFGGGHPNNSLIGELPDKSTRVILYLEDNKASSLEPSTRKKRSAEQTVQVVQSVSTGASDTVMGQERWQSFGLGPKAGQRAGRLYFNDQRKFGWMRLIPTNEVPNIDFMKKLGPEPLAASFNAKAFADRLKTRPKTSVKAALLDQSVIAGVGNIYADESLWGAKIHPNMRVKDLSSQKLNKLFEELRFVLKLSISKGGSTDKNYVDAEGKRGSYLTFAKVFRREDQACPRCNATIIKIRVAGRGTHLCPKCQKL